MVKSYVITTALVGLATIASVAVGAKEFSPNAAGQVAQSPISPIIQFDPPPAPDLGEPKGRVSGGRRGDCQRYAAATPLVPTVKIRQQDSLWGLTTSDRPMLWVYFPEGIADKLPFDFWLQDATGQPIYQTSMTASAIDTGVVAFALPPTAPKLQANQRYQWNLALYCAADIEPPVILRGTVQKARLEPDQVKQLAVAPTPLEQARLYAKFGIWYDALKTLAVAQQKQPSKELGDAWKTLLKQSNLEQAAAAPLLSPKLGN